MMCEQSVVFIRDQAVLYTVVPCAWTVNLSVLRAPSGSGSGSAMSPRSNRMTMCIYTLSEKRTKDCRRALPAVGDLRRQLPLGLARVRMAP